MLIKPKYFLYLFILIGLIIAIFGFLYPRDGWVLISTIYSGIAVLVGVSFQLIFQRNKENQELERQRKDKLISTIASLNFTKFNLISFYQKLNQSHFIEYNKMQTEYMNKRIDSSVDNIIKCCLFAKTEQSAKCMKGEEFTEEDKLRYETSLNNIIRCNFADRKDGYLESESRHILYCFLDDSRKIEDKIGILKLTIQDISIQNGFLDVDPKIVQPFLNISFSEVDFADFSFFAKYNNKILVIANTFNEDIKRLNNIILARNDYYFKGDKIRVLDLNLSLLNVIRECIFFAHLLEQNMQDIFRKHFIEDCRITLMPNLLQENINDFTLQYDEKWNLIQGSGDDIRRFFC